jgi:hypothetical protein
MSETRYQIFITDPTRSSQQDADIQSFGGDSDLDAYLAARGRFELEINRSGPRTVTLFKFTPERAPFTRKKLRECTVYEGEPRLFPNDNDPED